MNSLLSLAGIESWKPLLTALLLPPVPMLMLAALAGVVILRRRGFGALLLALALALTWLSTCSAVGQWLASTLLDIPPALSAARRAELRQARPASTTAIIVLGGGVEPLAPEYGQANLPPRSMERLIYGLWLGRETGIAVGFSGGSGWAQSGGSAADAVPPAGSEARVAARIAAAQFGQPLRWVEDRSRDTRENAAFSVALLRAAGVRRVLIVTHGWHMPRALRAFRDAAGAAMVVEPAPMGLASPGELPVLRWLPSTDGYMRVHQVMREWLGRRAGA